MSHRQPSALAEKSADIGQSEIPIFPVGQFGCKIHQRNLRERWRGCGKVGKMGHVPNCPTFLRFFSCCLPISHTLHSTLPTIHFWHFPIIPLSPHFPPFPPHSPFPRRLQQARHKHKHKHKPHSPPFPPTSPHSPPFPPISPPFPIFLHLCGELTNSATANADSCTAVAALCLG